MQRALDGAGGASLVSIEDDSLFAACAVLVEVAHEQLQLVLLSLRPVSTDPGVAPFIDRVRKFMTPFEVILDVIKLRMSK